MLEKIKNILDPKIEAELEAKETLIENRKAFIEANESTEDEKIMLEVLTSKNMIKRLESELPEMEERVKHINMVAKNLLVAHEWKKGKKEELLELKKAANCIDDIRAKLHNGKLKSASEFMRNIRSNRYKDMPGIVSLSSPELNEALDVILDCCKQLEHSMKTNEEFLGQYPKVKKLLKW